jgi:hypothetical protein
MFAESKRSFRWLDLLLLLFLAGLAIADPIDEPHKQIILLAIAISQWLESRLVAWQPVRGAAYSVLLKILLATLLLDHTGTIAIESSYYPIYYLPVVTAAVYFGPVGTLLWTTLASAAYCSYLFPVLVLQEYELTRNGLTELALRVLFFYLAGLVVNRFAIERRRQTEQYRRLATELAETNVQLEPAVPSVWPRSASFPPDSRTKSVTPSASSKAPRSCSPASLPPPIRSPANWPAISPAK